LSVDLTRLRLPVLDTDIVIAHSEECMTCEEQGPNASESTLGDPDPASVPADGTSTATLTVTVEDDNGVAIIDLEESDFEFGCSGDADIGGFSNEGEGVYTFTVTNETAETLEICLTVDGVDLGTFDELEFTPVPDATESELSGPTPSS